MAFIEFGVSDPNPYSCKICEDKRKITKTGPESRCEIHKYMEPGYIYPTFGAIFHETERHEYFKQCQFSADAEKLPTNVYGSEQELFCPYLPKGEGKIPDTNEEKLYYNKPPRSPGKENLLLLDPSSLSVGEQIVRKLLISSEFTNTVLVGHGDYLGFLYSALISLSSRPRKVMEKHLKLKCIVFPYNAVTCVSLSNYLDEPAEEIPKTFNVHEPSINFFPWLANTPSMFGYNDSDPPDLKFWEEISDSPEVLQKKADFVAKLKGTNFCLAKELAIHVSKKAAILTKSACRFVSTTYILQESLRKGLGSDKPFLHVFGENVSSWAAFSYAILAYYALANWPLKSLKFSEVGAPTGNCSLPEYEYISYVAYEEGKKGQNVFGAFQSPEGTQFYNRMSLDGLKARNREAVLLNGCFYHSCERKNCPTRLNQKRKAEEMENQSESLGDYLEGRSRRVEQLRQLEKLKQDYPSQIKSYDIRWQCEWEEMKAKDLNVISFMKKDFVPFLPFKPGRTAQPFRLKPRRAVKSCHNEVLNLKWLKKDFPEEECFFLDAISLYASCMFKYQYPINQVEIIVGENARRDFIFKDHQFVRVNNVKSKTRGFFGLALIGLCPPRFAPGLLPYAQYRNQAGDRIGAPLCRVCFEELLDAPCTHDDVSRSFMFEGTIQEIEFMSKNLKYGVISIYELYIWESSALIFQDLVRHLAHYKIKYSGKMENFSKELAQINKLMGFENTDLELKPDMIEDNPALRKCFKSCLNSSFGKLIQKNDYSHSVLCESDEEIVECLLQNEVTNIINVSEKYVKLICAPKSEERKSSNKCQFIAGLYVLSYARMDMYKHMLTIFNTPGNRAHYIDCDGIVFSCKKDSQIAPLPQGYSFGCFRPQIKDCKEITHWLACGNKAYLIVYITKSNEVKSICRLRGFSLDQLPSQSILANAEVFERFITSMVNDVSEVIQVEQLRVKHNASTYEKYSCLLTYEFANNAVRKRRVLRGEFVTKPYGSPN